MNSQSSGETSAWTDLSSQPASQGGSTEVKCELKDVNLGGAGSRESSFLLCRACCEPVSQCEGGNSVKVQPV